MKLRRGG